MKKNYNLHGGERGAAIAVQVYPKAQHNEIMEVTPDGAVRIMLRSSARASEVNRNLIQFLAGVLSVRQSQVEVVAGAKSDKKLVSVLDISAQTAHERIVNNLS